MILESTHDTDTPCTLTLEVSTTVIHSNDDCYELAYDSTDIFGRFSEALTHRAFRGNSVIQDLRERGMLEDYERGTFKFKEFVSAKLRQINPDHEYVRTNLEMWDHKRGLLTMRAQFDTEVGRVREALEDEKIKELLKEWELKIE